MKPIDLGFPPKFSDWRPHQLNAIITALCTDKFAHLIDAPCGSGKSALAFGIHRLTKKKTLYLVSTKQLQDQLAREFEGYIVVLKGRSNYPCLAWPGGTADDCTHTEGNPCNYRGICPYRVAKAAALQAPIACLNYSYFMHETEYVGRFSGYPLVICDEFDTLEGELLGYISVSLSSRELTRMKRYDIGMPKRKTVPSSWLAWARDAIPKLEADILPDDELLTMSLEELREQRWLNNKVRKLKMLSTELEKQIECDERRANGEQVNHEEFVRWVFYQDDKKEIYEFKPVWISRYADAYLWRHMQRVVGMSATILNPAMAANTLGLRDISYDALPSTFPAERRPVYYRPITEVTLKTKDKSWPRIRKAVDDILLEYPDAKALVHCVSYEMTQYMMQNLTQRGRLVTHNPGNRAERIAEFKESTEPLVFLSPSMDRGVDLPLDQCRLIICCKMPAPYLGDPQVQQRVYAGTDGDRWYAYTQITSLIQSTGRGMRSADDSCDAYILDAEFSRLLNQNYGVFPRWWLDALVSQYQYYNIGGDDGGSTGE